MVAAAEPPAKYLVKKNVSAPALRTAFRIFEAWGLSNQEQMKLLGNALLLRVGRRNNYHCV
jgi:hypothetical protein